MCAYAACQRCVYSHAACIYSKKRHFVPFFLLPYGITAENQPFNDSLANDLLIDIKTNLLYYRMIILYIAIILAIIGRFCL